MELEKMPNFHFSNKDPRMKNHLENNEFHKYDDSHILKDSDLINKIWDESENASIFDKIDISYDWNLVKGKISGKTSIEYKKKSLINSYFLRIAALVIITSGLSVGFYKLFIVSKKTTSDVVNYIGENHIKNIFLPDGSVVTLNAGSILHLKADFGLNSRDVILKGDAFFSVMPSQKLPFKVYTGNSVVEVTGTKFSVHESKGKVQVSVVTGKVLLSSMNSVEKQIIIRENQSGYFLSDNELKLVEGIPVNTLSWKTGQLIFEHTPIDSALIDIAKHFRKELSLNIDIQEKITAEFQNQPLNEILDEISLVAGLHFDTTSTALIVRK